MSQWCRDKDVRSGCVATIPVDCKWLQIKVVRRSSLFGEDSFPEEDKTSESFKLAGRITVLWG
jgi:hypothetical protein